MSANWGDEVGNDSIIHHPQPQNVIDEATEAWRQANLTVDVRIPPAPGVESYDVNAYQGNPLWMDGIDYNYTQTRRQRLRSLIGRVDHYAIGIGRSVLVGLAGFAAGSQWYAGNNGVAAYLGVATLALAAMAYLELP